MSNSRATSTIALPRAPTQYDQRDEQTTRRSIEQAIEDLRLEITENRNILSKPSSLALRRFQFLAMGAGSSGSSTRQAGSFTPTVQDYSFSNGEGQTYTEQHGVYRVYDDLVFISLTVAINSIGTLTGTDHAHIAGLPFAATAGAYYSVTCGYGDSLNLGGAYMISGLVQAGGSVIELYKWSAATGSTVLTVTELSAGGQLYLDAWYLR